MKIEIHNEADGYKLYLKDSSFPEQNYRKSINGRYIFNEDDIYYLIGEKNYKKFEDGKYIFEVTKNHLTLITGNRSAQNISELLMYND